jgi:hypothetical protein
VSGQLHAPAALPPGESPWYPLDRRFGGPQNHSGRGGEEKNSQPPPVRPLGRPRHRWQDNIKMDLWEIGIDGRTGFGWLRIGSTGGLL